MNNTTVLFSWLKDSNSTGINNQSWFVPLDILLIIFLALTIISALFFLSTVLFDQTCHTVSLMLVANSCIAMLCFSITAMWMIIISLHNDLNQIQYEDPLCKFRSYISYAACSQLLYSFLLQAIYRYVIVMYPNRLFCQSAKLQLCLIVLTWLAALICTSPYILTGEIKYLVDDQICQMPVHLSILLVYNVFYIYLLPVSCIILIYFKLIYHVKQISRRMTQNITLFRAQRELRMLHRIVINVCIILTFGTPYMIFTLMGFFGQQPPKYYFRIAFTFGYISLFCFIIVLFQSTDPVKASIIKRINRQQIRVIHPMT